MMEYHKVSFEEVLRLRLPGFDVVQSLSPMGTITVGIGHTCSVPYNPTLDAKGAYAELVRQIDQAILGTEPVKTLKEDLAKMDAQVAALLEKIRTLQRYEAYVEVTKEIAKEGAK